MAGIYIKTSRGYLTSDLNIASALLSQGALLGSQKLAEPKKNVPCYVLEGIDSETKKTVQVFIPQVDSREATEKIKMFGWELSGIYQPSIHPVVVFELLPKEGDTSDTLEKWVQKWFRGRLEVNAKLMSEKRRDLSVMAHNIQIMQVKDVPKELRGGA